MKKGRPCYYCGCCEGNTKDHYLAKSLIRLLRMDGIKVARNYIVPACAHCNNSKGAMTVEQFRDFLRQKHAVGSTKHVVQALASHDFVFAGERDSGSSLRIKMVPGPDVLVSDPENMNYDSRIQGPLAGVRRGLEYSNQRA